MNVCHVLIFAQRNLLKSYVVWDLNEIFASSDLIGVNFSLIVLGGGGTLSHVSVLPSPLVKKKLKLLLRQCYYGENTGTVRYFLRRLAQFVLPQYN